jgi:hypothetical protein
VDIKGPTDGGYDIYQVKKYASALKSDQFAPQYFSRFSAVTDITHGDKVFGGTAWRAVAQQPSEAKSALPLLLPLPSTWLAQFSPTRNTPAASSGALAPTVLMSSTASLYPQVSSRRFASFRVPKSGISAGQRSF